MIDEIKAEKDSNYKLFTIQQTAKIINCHPNTLRKWDKTGILSPIRIGKRKDRRYTKTQIDEIINQQGNENNNNNNKQILNKLVQKTSSENEERFKIALKDNNIIFFTQDCDLRFTWIYYSHPQFSPESIIGKTESEVLGKKSSEFSLPIKQRILKTGKPEKFELNMTNLGYKQTYDVRLQPIINAAGRVIGIAGIAIEITEQKELKEKIRKIERSTRAKKNR